MTEERGGGGDVRLLALEILLETEGGGQSHLILKDVLDKYAYLEKRDRAFLSRLAEGTLEYRLQLDYMIDLYAKTPVKKQKPVIRNLLRMSVYQLLYMDSVPVHAVCSEAVRLARRKGFAGLTGFVNGVLRTIAKAQQSEAGIPFPKEENGEAYALSVRYSTPQWIVEKWLSAYDVDIVKKMLQSSVSEPPLCVRCRPADSVQECIQLLAEEGVQAKAHPYAPYALTLKGVDKLSALRLFTEGRIAVQDVSSMLAVRIAAPKNVAQPQEAALQDAASDAKEKAASPLRVIDVCASPGGKSLFMADLLGKDGVVYARDVSEYKAVRIKENAARLGVQNVIVQVKDACIFYAEDERSADVVLADVPCSGLGVLARKKELRYRLSEADMESLVSLQRQILRTVWRYVKPGGALIYSTCTVNRAENEENVKWFCSEYPFEAASLKPYLPEALKGEPYADEGFLQLLPGVHACDGFFMARLVRRGA